MVNCSPLKLRHLWELFLKGELAMQRARGGGSARVAAGLKEQCTALAERLALLASDFGPRKAIAPAVSRDGDHSGSLFK
jgi:hypothetical protein